MAAIEVFHSPEGLDQAFLDFFKRQSCYKLNQLVSKRSVLSQYIGVYALYYHGGNPLYVCIAEANKRACCLPIYVGKAVPSGRRTGRQDAPGHMSTKSNLYNRLNEHRRSIEQGNNLAVGAFSFRVAAMDFDLVSWGESVSIRFFQPVWNQTIDGFGIHDPGSGRAQQRQSVWDILHPGRTFTGKLPNADTVDEASILHEIEDLCGKMRKQLRCL